MSNLSAPNLPGCSVVSEVVEHGSEPVVDLIQSALFVWRLQDRLQSDRQREIQGHVVTNHVMECIK